jgi:hypothetical protein
MPCACGDTAAPKSLICFKSELETTAWSPQGAIKLLNWLTDIGTLDYSDAVACIVEGSLQSPAPPVLAATEVICHLLVPISDTSDRDVVELLVDAAFADGGRTAAFAVAASIARAAQVYAAQSARRGWRQAVAAACDKHRMDLATIGLSADDLAALPDDLSSSQVLKLRDGRVLSRWEVAAARPTEAGIRVLLEMETEDSHLDWEPAGGPSRVLRCSYRRSGS